MQIDGQLCNTDAFDPKDLSETSVGVYVSGKRDVTR